LQAIGSGLIISLEKTEEIIAKFVQKDVQTVLVYQSEIQPDDLEIE
jgi:hypothetical protein